MSEEPVVYPRSELKKGEKLAWDFKFAGKLKAGTVLVANDISVSVNPVAELTVNATVVIANNTTAQIIFEAGVTAIVNKEYECTVQASKNGEVGILKLVIMVRPA